jgi:hypothetical protein
MSDDIQVTNPKHQVVARRIAICKSCPQLIKGVNLCRSCGCFAPAKVRIMNESCPQGRWFQYNPNDPGQGIELDIQVPTGMPGGTAS